MKKLFGISILLVLLLSACDKTRIFDENKSIDGGWSWNNPIEFSVDIPDTLTPVNAYINIRNTSAYRFSNIYVFMTTTFPNGKQAKDTLNCLLADERGKWLGKGAGDLWDNRIMIKHNVYFNQKGTYRFKLEQAMRIDPLPDITDVGIRIEKATGKN